MCVYMCIYVCLFKFFRFQVGTCCNTKHSETNELKSSPSKKQQDPHRKSKVRVKRREESLSVSKNRAIILMVSEATYFIIKLTKCCSGLKTKHGQCWRVTLWKHDLWNNKLRSFTVQSNLWTFFVLVASWDIHIIINYNLIYVQLWNNTPI